MEKAEQIAALQSPLTVTIALIVATVAVIGNSVTSTIVAAVVGAVAGAAAGVSNLQSLWKAEARKITEVIAIAVAGGLAGTATAILHLLLGTQLLTGTAVTGALAGAAMVARGRTQLQWPINTIEWVIANSQWAVDLVKRVNAVLPVERLIGVLRIAAATIFKKVLQAAGSLAAGSQRNGKTPTQSAVKIDLSFRNSLEIAAYRKLETEYSKWIWRLRSAMKEIENKLHNQIENGAIHEVKETALQRELEKTSKDVKKSMPKFYEKDMDKDILIQWQISFEIKINELQDNIVDETKRKLNEVLQQRELMKDIGDQRKHQENTLYEKSKELALKLKNKANDEETLKNIFDLFWKQCVNTPPIEDIDIMSDVRDILIETYGCVSVDQSKDIFSVSSYSDYVKVKESSGLLTIAFRSSKEDEVQIRAFVMDVAQQTEKEIQSFNISNMGYNKNCIQKITGYIKTSIVQHEKGPVKYEFKNEFFMDLVISICKRANTTITDQHKTFWEAIDPVPNLKKKREEYYRIFQICCQGATSAAIYGEIIFQKLKESIVQSVYKKTARDLTDEMRSNCESLNGNRSNVEKHILKTLAEEGDFDKYMKYIKTPRDHFKSFIRDKVSRYITDKFSVSVLPKMKENIKLLQQKIMKAALESTKHVQVNREDVGLWLKRFTQQLSDELIFSEKDLSGVKHDDVDVKLLEDVIKHRLPDIIDVISSGFTETFPVKLEYKCRPDELLIDHFCQCCWVQCPFCRAICTNTIENHDEDHCVSVHRVDGINGWHYKNTKDLSVGFCTTLVASDKSFIVSDESFPYKEYKRAGGDYANWSITPDHSELSYWKWFVCRFQEDLEKCYNKKFQGCGKIPDEWKKHKQQDAIQSLDNLCKESQ